MIMMYTMHFVGCCFIHMYFRKFLSMVIRWTSRCWFLCWCQEKLPFFSSSWIGETKFLRNFVSPIQLEEKNGSEFIAYHVSGWMFSSNFLFSLLFPWIFVWNFFHFLYPVKKSIDFPSYHRFDDLFGRRGNHWFCWSRRELSFYWILRFAHWWFWFRSSYNRSTRHSRFWSDLK